MPVDLIATKEEPSQHDDRRVRLAIEVFCYCAICAGLKWAQVTLNVIGTGRSWAGTDGSV